MSQTQVPCFYFYSGIDKDTKDVAICFRTTKIVDVKSETRDTVELERSLGRIILSLLFSVVGFAFSTVLFFLYLALRLHLERHTISAQRLQCHWRIVDVM
jgi:hypothetical protein